jgi:hypothetical protein
MRASYRWLGTHLHLRRPVHRGGRVQRSNTGSQYGSEPSVGSIGHSYCRSLIRNESYEADPIHRSGPWQSFEAVESSGLTWVDWF